LDKEIPTKLWQSSANPDLDRIWMHSGFTLAMLCTFQVGMLVICQ